MCNCSCPPDQAALVVDAFLIPWTEHASSIHYHSKVFEQESSNDYSSLAQPAVFPQLLSSLVDYPILLPVIVNSTGGSHHPLAVQGHLLLAAWPVSSEQVVLDTFLNELSMSPRDLGGSQLNWLTLMHGSSGIAGALNEGLIPFQLL